MMLSDRFTKFYKKKCCINVTELLKKKEVT